MTVSEYCPATQEAVIERELEGDTGCPLCGRTAEDHAPEKTSGPVTVIFARVQEAQAAFLACERLRVAGRWPGKDWAGAGQEAELTIHDALKKINANDF